MTRNRYKYEIPCTGGAEGDVPVTCGHVKIVCITRIEYSTMGGGRQGERGRERGQIVGN